VLRLTRVTRAGLAVALLASLGLGSSVALVFARPLAAEPEPAQSELVRLASGYVDRFVEAFANVIAEERYTQEAEWPKRRRTLRSNFVVVRNPGATQWYTFREVLEVDGKPVEEAPAGRLIALLEDPPDDALRRAREITVAGARYNVENIGTVNNPLLAMSFLRGEYRDRFRFTVGGRERKLGPTVRKITFEETRIPTILTQEGGAAGREAVGQHGTRQQLARMEPTHHNRHDVRVGQTARHRCAGRDA
jgi:hypothetical protein